jgi:hypothetical protein
MNTKISQYIIPRLQDILFLVILLMALTLGQRMLNMDGDLPRHLLTGKYILESQKVPTTEPFAYPYAGRTYVSHEWLTDVVFYLVYSVSGTAGIVLLAGILLATTSFFLYKISTKYNNSKLLILFLVIWGIGITSLNWVTRPHLVSMLFLVIWMGWVDKLVHNEPIAIWRFPVMMLIWANMHGEFIAGILVLCAYAAGWVWDYLTERDKASVQTGKKIFFALVSSLIATAINPGGLGPWFSIFGFVKNNYLMSRMAESNPPNFQQGPFLVILAMLVFSIAILGIRKEPIPTGKSILLAGFSAMCLIAARNTHLYGLVAPFVLAGAMVSVAQLNPIKKMESILLKTEKDLKGVLWPVATLLIFSIITLASPITAAYKFDKTFFPVDAIEWMKKNPQKGKIFNNLDWGGYIAFNLWPKQSVFIDSMTDVTGELTREFEIVSTLSSGWQKILEKYQIELVIMPPDSALARNLQGNNTWVTLYQDNTAIILSKNHSP